MVRSGIGTSVQLGTGEMYFLCQGYNRDPNVTSESVLGNIY